MTFFDFLIAVSKHCSTDNPNWKKVQSLFTLLRLQMLNRTSTQLFSLLKRRLRIRLFSRRDYDNHDCLHGYLHENITSDYWEDPYC